MNEYEDETPLYFYGSEEFEINDFYLYEKYLHVPFGGYINDSTQRFSINYNGKKYFEKDVQLVMKKVVERIDFWGAKHINSNAVERIDPYEEETPISILDRHNKTLVYEDAEALILFEYIEFKVTKEGELIPVSIRCKHLFLKRKDINEIGT